MQTSLSSAFPFLSPVIRALIGGTRLGHRDVPHDKAIRGNFSDGQVPGEGEQRDGKRTLVPLEHPSAWSKGCRGMRQTGARPSAIGKVFAENPRCGSRARDSDVPSFLFSLCYGFR